MALHLPDRWVWDSWHADDGERLHLFYLQAPRSLGDPASRHFNATIGHAVSEDLRTWEVLDDALGPGPAGAWDDLATWTGSIIADGDLWWMFYTGCSTVEHGLVQRIGAATSTDLLHWNKVGDAPLIEADGRWYERLGSGRWHDEAWRDPWVFADPGGDGFHALITARVPHGPVWSAGVVGHAWSPDLRYWDVRPPRSGHSGFGQLEVLQPATTERGHMVLFSYDDRTLDRVTDGPSRRPSTYIAPADGPLGPYDFQQAIPIGPAGTFAGRLVHDRAGQAQLVAFVDSDGTDDFVGTVTDPIALAEVWPDGSTWPQR